MPVQRAHTGNCVPITWNDRSGRWWQIRLPAAYIASANAYPTLDACDCGRLAARGASNRPIDHTVEAATNARRSGFICLRCYTLTAEDAEAGTLSPPRL